MVCDKDAGRCVPCFKSSHCDEEEYCMQGYCVADVCAPPESMCQDNQVVACVQDGSGYETVEVCGTEQYCEELACIDYVCTPEAEWCDGEVYKVCAEDGKSVAEEQDCAAEEQHCFAGGCLDTVCLPGEDFCEDPATLAHCKEDGGGFTTETCPDKHYCDDTEGAQCLPWLCTPSQAFCDGNTAKVCNAEGSGILNEMDCGDLVCTGGQCKELVCEPDESWCEDASTAYHCSDDGLSLEVEHCDPGHSCDDAQCKAWVCTPGEPMCNGDLATVCNAMGLGPAADGTDCTAEEGVCQQGVCIDCFAECTGKQCGDDGCGGSCGQCLEGQYCINGLCPAPGFQCDDGNDKKWDGCTNGMISEFILNDEQYLGGDYAAVASFSDGRYVVVWKGDHAAAEDVVVGRMVDAGGSLYGSVFKVSDEGGKDIYQPNLAVLDDDHFVVAWTSRPKNGDYEQGNVFARVYQVGAFVEAQGPVFMANTQAPLGQYFPRMAALQDGHFVTSWTVGSGGNERDVEARLFDATGNPLGSEVTLNSYVPGFQIESSIAAVGTGFFAVWYSENQDGSGDGIVGRGFGADLSPLTEEVIVNEVLDGDQLYPWITSTSSGDLLVVWEDQPTKYEADIVGRLIGADGQPKSQAFLVNVETDDKQTRPRVTALTNGHAAVVWNQGGPTDTVCINARILEPQGTPVTDELAPCTVLAGGQYWASVAALPNGSFVVVWRSQPGNNVPPGIYAQRFDKDGNKLFH